MPSPERAVQIAKADPKMLGEPLANIQIRQVR
jgi:hypothetical protein